MALHSNFRFEEFHTPYFSTHIPEKADVIIVGGGLAGLLTLYYLTIYSKLNVFLLEEGGIGHHASGRAIGNANLFDFSLIKELIKNSTNDLNRLKNDISDLNNLICSEQIECDYNKSGSIYVGSDTNEISTLCSLYKATEKNVFGYLINSSEIPSYTGSSFFKSGLYIPNDFIYNPFKLIHSLANLCEHSGRKILTNCCVDNIIQTQDGINVHVRNRGVIATKRVVYCTGVYTGKVISGINKFLSSYKQHIIVTKKIDEKILSKIYATNIVFNGIKIKIFNNRIFIQSSPILIHERFYDGEINLKVCENLRKLLKLIYPEIGGVEIEYVWSTVNCSGIDGLPISGELFNKPNEYINIGFTSNNIITCSSMIASMISNLPVSENLKKMFDPKRINNV